MRAEKKLLTGEYVARLNASPFFIVVGYQGLKVAHLSELRKRLTQAGAEIDINPLLASAERIVALDARVVVHGLDMTEDKLPTSAIRPYPLHLVKTWKMKDGNDVVIRPIRPEDEPMMIEFHKKLSERTVYLRYFQPLKLTQRTAHHRLT